MDRQKLLLGVLSGVITIALLFFVYQQMNKSQQGENMPNNAMMEKAETPKPLPKTVDGVADEIEAESALDDKAIQEEIDAETSAVSEDSDALNSLGQSYDENSL